MHGELPAQRFAQWVPPRSKHVQEQSRSSAGATGRRNGAVEASDRSLCSGRATVDPTYQVSRLGTHCG